MSGRLEVMEAGVAVTIQDRGRFGFRSIGVPVSGALDPVLLAAANRLLGNALDAAGLEILLRGPALRALRGPVRVALAGEVGARLVRADGTTARVAPWQTASLLVGDAIQIGVVGRGVAYVGITGGVAVPSQLGSRSTYRRAGLGGVRGRALAAGDELACEALRDDPRLEYCGTVRLEWAAGPIRAIPGPQEEHFTPAALAAFFGMPFQVTREMDRMGMRLAGPRLTHSERGAEIVSDGVAPGAVQVPASGQPIVLLADCQTTGGYPKIATVIAADLPRLAHLRPGDEIRFCRASHAEAAAARQAQAEAFARWSAGIRPCLPAGAVDERALYSGELISGAVRGDEMAMGAL